MSNNDLPAADRVVKPDDVNSQEQLDGDDSNGSARSSEALVDGDAIGAALRDEPKKA